MSEEVISFKARGQRVRHREESDSKGYYWYGRIAYYDHETKLVWVVWDPDADTKIPRASGWPAKSLVRVNY